ncbi:hypothetical protein [Pseudoxanthomonas suwonensis]|uniref:hypothetical protein n=1 Tax=Pseudoxanthomonas suwonensis TaxID=314722 RepID=UPI000466228C|nr:hypothetical protein [Pseudoxanthomonas suwonensis]
MHEADETLAKQWDNRGAVSRSGRLFSLLMRPLGYPHLEGGRVIEAYRGPQAFVDACGLDEDAWARHFDQWDRAASRAAHRHRDRVVLLHFLAALAVLTAVLGAIGFLGHAMGLFWALAEVAILVGIVLMVRNDRNPKKSTHHAWLSCRKQAERFRAEALARIPAAPGIADEATRRAAILALLEDQIGYQAKAHDRWEKLHGGLERATRRIFYLVLVAAAGHLVPIGVESWRAMGNAVPHAVEVVAHFFHSPKWLIITAAGPAFAACLHGIASKLEVKRLASQAGAMAARLSALKLELESLGPDNGRELERLAQRIGDELTAEHSNWLSLVEHAELEEPA